MVCIAFTPRVVAILWVDVELSFHRQRTDEATNKAAQSGKGESTAIFCEAP